MIYNIIKKLSFLSFLIFFLPNIIYADRVTNGLQVLYEFNETSGTTIYDTSNIGTALNLTVLNSNRVSHTSTNLSINSATIIENTTNTNKIYTACQASNEITIEAMVKAKSASQGGPARIVTLSKDQSKRNFTLGQDGTTYQIRLRTSTQGGNGHIEDTGVTVSTTQNQHVVFTKSSNGSGKFYVDGVERKNWTAGTFGGNFNNWNANYDFALGNEVHVASTNTDRDWQGTYEHVAIYSRALSSTEVLANFNASSNCPDDSSYIEILNKPFDTNDISDWNPIKFDTSISNYTNKSSVSAWGGQTSNSEWDNSDWTINSNKLWWNRNGSSGSADEYGILAYDNSQLNYNTDGLSYSISTDINLFPDSVQNNDAGIVFGYVDASNYYIARWTKVGTGYASDTNFPGFYRELALVKMTNGSPTKLDATSFYKSNAFTLKVHVNNNGIIVCIDGETKLTDNANQPQLGTFGLYTYDNDHGASFDNVMVKCDDCSLKQVIPIAEYRFDECVYTEDPNKVIDSINGDNSGTITGATATISKDIKIIGHALELNGGAVDINDLPVATQDGKKNTVMFWMYWNGANGIMPFGWQRHDLWFTGGNFGFNSGNGDLYGISSAGLANGWHHVTAVFTNKDLHSNKLYIDGVEQNLSQLRNSPNNNRAVVSTSARIGGWKNDNNYRFKSYLDELKIYQGEVFSSEIAAIYANESAGKNFDGSTRETVVCMSDALIVDYRFDECEWSGALQEIKDSSGNNFHTAAENVDTTDQSSVMNNSGDFTSNSTTDYIPLEHSLLNNITDFTISTWIKTTNTSKQAILSAAQASEDNELLFWLGGTQFSPFIKGSSQNISIPDIADDSWHHLVWTREGRQNCIYIDGTLEGGCINLSDAALNIDPNGLIIGQEQDTLGGSFDIAQDYEGYLDEFKIFNKALTSSDISNIYNRENNDKNYNGTVRETVDCTPATLIAEYRFDACEYTNEPNEVIDTIGGDNSGTITGATATISKDIKIIGHALELNGGAVDIDNLAVATQDGKKNTVIFWMYWNGANSIMPFGWQRHDLWFTGGNFGFNSASGDLYGISSAGLANGWHHVTAIFTNKDLHSNKLYIDGVKQNLTQLQNSPNNTRAVVSTSARIGGWKASNGYRFKSYLDELKIYQGEVFSSEIAAIYANESSGKNFDGSIRNSVICGKATFNAVDQNGGCFNWDNNITTKIAGDNINLTILSRDSETNTTINDVNITKLELLSFSNLGCNTLYATDEIWNGNQSVDTNGCFNPTAFTHDKAIKCAKIKITGISDSNIIESNSSDTFSIRPKTFSFENIPMGKLIAEHDYTFKANALNADGTTQTPDYNTSVTPSSTLRFRNGSENNGSLSGTFTMNPTSFNFSDGESSDTNLSFNNVGVVSLELNDTAWAAVDSDDTPLIDRTIYTQTDLTFIPHHFKITHLNTPTMEDNNTHYTYLSNDLNMSAWLKNLSVTVTAEGEQNGSMTNYQNPMDRYFANLVNIVTTLEIPNTPHTTTQQYNFTAHDLTFNAGVATLAYQDVRFNYPRDYKQPVNHFTILGSDTNLTIQISDTIDTAVIGSSDNNFNGNATFYYGKVVTRDIKTTENSINSAMDIQVYNENSFASFKQLTANWYLNDFDNFTQIALSDFYPRSSYQLNSTNLSLDTSVQNIIGSNNGQITFDISNNKTDSYKTIYHIDIPSWLWYSRYKPYSFSGSSDCSQHPCFEYIFESENDENGISSGDFNGTNFENNFNSGIKKKAIKLMR